MKSVDIIFLILLLFGAYRGFKKGLVVELVMILSFLIAVAAGVSMMGLVAEILHQYIDGYRKFIPYLAFILIFILVTLVINVVGAILKRGLDLTPLGAFDNAAGALMGILKWAFGLSFVLWLFSKFGFTLPITATADTNIYPIVVSIAPIFMEYLSTLIPIRELWQHIDEPKTV